MTGGSSSLKAQDSAALQLASASVTAGSDGVSKEVEAIDASYLAFERRFQRTQMWDVVSNAIEKALEERNWSQKDIAYRLGKDPATISRWLSNPSNWQIDTIAELLCAIDAEPRLSVFVHGEICRTVGSRTGSSVATMTKGAEKIKQVTFNQSAVFANLNSPVGVERLTRTASSVVMKNAGMLK